MQSLWGNMPVLRHPLGDIVQGQHNAAVGQAPAVLGVKFSIFAKIVLVHKCLLGNFQLRTASWREFLISAWPKMLGQGGGGIVRIVYQQLSPIIAPHAAADGRACLKHRGKLVVEIDAEQGRFQIWLRHRCAGPGRRESGDPTGWVAIRIIRTILHRNWNHFGAIGWGARNIGWAVKSWHAVLCARLSWSSGGQCTKRQNNHSFHRSTPRFLSFIARQSALGERFL